GDATDVDRLERVPERRMRDRRVVAEELLDRVRHGRRVGAKPGQLFGMAEESDDAVPEEAARRIVPRDDQLEDGRHQLLLAELLLAVARADQGADQRIVRMAALLGDQSREELDDRVRRGARTFVLLRRRGGSE